jgi:D-alanyl-D-alanine carboxypeptidase/D-alanyl-D-alanine-endopeptidase (penicillin-binding protein 4)
MDFSRRLGLGCVAIAAGLSSMVAAAEASLCPATLPAALDAAIAQTPLERAYVGMVLQTEGTTATTQPTLYARNADQFFTPASGAKLFTTAAALHRLGADYRIRTAVYGSPGPAGSTNLLLVGRGDPTLTDSRLSDLAKQLAQSGVTRVNQLVLQDAYFPQFATNPTWEWGDAQWYYAPPVNSLILNGNAITVQVAPTQVGRPLALSWPSTFPSDPLPIVNNTLTVAPQAEAIPLKFWRTGGDAPLRVTGELPYTSDPRAYHLAVLNPAEQFANVLVRILEHQSISVAQTEITEVPSAIPGAELATLESPPLRELIMLTNQNSNNLYAEVLLKTLGVTYGDSPVTDASAAGGVAIATALAELGIDPTTVRLADGSGLSRHNLVTPAAMVETLQAMARHPQADIFRNSLAVAGINGTLRNRLGGTALENRVQGKSGALTGNVSLSGYLQPPDYEPLVFSIMINHSDQHARVLREQIDEILLLIAQLSDDC